jgi:hypothetical protein
MKKILSILTLVVLIGLTPLTAQNVMDFTMTDTDGNDWTFYDVLRQGNTVILDFMYVDCPPCQASTPALQDIWSDYGKGAGSLYVMSFSTRASDSEAYVNQFRVTYGPNADYPAFTQQMCSQLYSFYANQYQSPCCYVPLFVVVHPNVNDPGMSTIGHTATGWGAGTDSEVRGDLPPSTVGVNEIAAINQVSIYPNPFLSEATIEFDLEESTNITVNVFDVTGKLVTEFGNTNYSIGNHKLTIDGSDMNNGLYYVNIITENGVMTEKLMLNK